MTKRRKQSPQQKGGIARAEKLSPERRQEIARIAIETRWLDPSKKLRLALNTQLRAILRAEEALAAIRDEAAVKIADAIKARQAVQVAIDALGE